MAERTMTGLRALALLLGLLVVGAACSTPTPEEGSAPSGVAASDVGSANSGSVDDGSAESETESAAASPSAEEDEPADSDGTGLPALGTVEVGSAAYDDYRPPAVPVRITMDAMTLDAPVIPVGIVEETGEMELPGAVEVAWYRHGPRPGSDAGSTVVAAHVDWNGRPGPFFELREVELGERIEVDLDDGTTAHYRVTEQRRFPKDELPPEFFRQTGDHELVMITCGGDFDERSRSYSDNIALIAVPVDAPSVGGAA